MDTRTKSYSLILLFCAVIAYGQNFSPAPPYLFSVSAYQVEGDSTLVFSLPSPVLVVRMVVTVDSAWLATDSLKVGTVGNVGQRPGNWWGSDSTSRGSDSTYKRIYLNATSWTGAARSLYLYHPGLLTEGNRIGKIEVYVWYQDFPQSDEYTVFRTE